MGIKRPTLKAAKDYIYNDLDFSLLEKKLTHKSYLGNRWVKADIKQGIKLYKNFLFLLRKYVDTQELLVPSEEIDEIWHNHILDTRGYFKDCQHIFGEYFHHYPYVAIDKQSNEHDLKKAFVKSQELYFQEFKEYY